MANKKTNVDIVLALDSKTLKRSVKTASNSFDSLQKDIKRTMFRAGKDIDAIGASLTKIGLAAGAAGVVVGGAFAMIAKNSIDAASDLEETQGKFDVVFAGMTKTAEKWSTTLQDAYVLNQTESKKYLASLQDLLVPTGMARDEAGEMAFEFTKLAADLASFNNLNTEDVIRDIASALQGSSETMAKYGVNVKAAKIEQEVLNQGWAKSKKDITDAMKAQALMNITMRQTTDAQGDLARTSNSYANQMRLAKKNVNDLQTAFGSGLLPAVNLTIQTLNKMFDENDVEEWGHLASIAVLEFAADTVEGIDSVYKVFNSLIGVLRLSQAGFMMLTQGIQYLFEQSSRMFGNTEKAEYWAQAQVKAQKTIEKAMGKAAESFDKAEEGLPALDNIAARIRQIKEEIAKPAEGKDDLTGEITDATTATKEYKDELVKVGDTWEVVNKKMAADTGAATVEFKDEYGRTWDELEKDAGKSINDILADLKKIRDEAEKPYAMKFVQDGYRTGGRFPGFRSGGRFAGPTTPHDNLLVSAVGGEGFTMPEALRVWDSKLGKGFFDAINAPWSPAGRSIMERMTSFPLNVALPALPSGTGRMAASSQAALRPIILPDIYGGASVMADPVNIDNIMAAITKAKRSAERFGQ